MPLLYGQGLSAFQRLQEHIIEKSVDQTIFAWKSASSKEHDQRTSFLASSPADFIDAANFVPLPLVTPPCRTTSLGVQFSVFLLSTELAESFRHTRRFPLACTDPRWAKDSWVDEPVEIAVRRSEDIAHHHAILTYERVSTHELYRSGNVAILRKVLTTVYTALGVRRTIVYLHAGTLPFAQTKAFKRINDFKAVIGFLKPLGILAWLLTSQRDANLGRAMVLLWYIAGHGAQAAMFVAVVVWSCWSLGESTAEIVGIVSMFLPSLVSLGVKLEFFGS